MSKDKKYHASALNVHSSRSGDFLAASRKSRRTCAQQKAKMMDGICLANDLYALYRSQTTMILPFRVFSKYDVGTSPPRPGAIWKYTTDSERLTHNHHLLPILP